MEDRDVHERLARLEERTAGTERRIGFAHQVLMWILGMMGTLAVGVLSALLIRSL